MVRAGQERIDQGHRALLVVDRFVFHRPDPRGDNQEALAESAAEAFRLQTTGNDAITADLKSAFCAGVNQVGYVALESKVIREVLFVLKTNEFESEVPRVAVVENEFPPFLK